MPTDEATARSLSFWGGRVADSSTRAATIAANHAKMYGGENPGYQGLQSYTSARPSKWLPNGSESPMNYLSRMRPVIGHLEEQLGAETFAAVVAAYQQAIEQVNGGQSHAELRTALDGRTSGTNVSTMPEASQRAQLLGNRGFAGEQQLQPFGHLAADTTIGTQPRASAADVNVILAQQAAQQQAAMQARTAQVRLVQRRGDLRYQWLS
jgi:hypothetical protein